MMAKLTGYWRQLSQLPGADGPLLRWGLLLCVILILWGWLFRPFLDWHQQRQALLEVKTRQLSKVLAVKATESDWLQAQQQFNQTYAQLEPHLFQEQTAASALAGLQGLLDRLLAEYDLKLENRRILDGQEEPGIGEKIGVGIRFTGPLISIIEFLDALASEDKLLVVEGMLITKTNRGVIANINVSAFRALTP